MFHVARIKGSVKVTLERPTNFSFLFSCLIRMFLKQVVKLGFISLSIQVRLVPILVMSCLLRITKKETDPLMDLFSGWAKE